MIPRRGYEVVSATISSVTLGSGYRRSSRYPMTTVLASTALLLSTGTSIASEALTVNGK